MIQAYPLTWPHGWKRTPTHQIAPAKFGKRTITDGRSYATLKGLSVADATTQIMAELSRLRARDIVLSTNVRVTSYGTPRSGDREPDDRGVAVYFTMAGKDRVLACDKWTRVADNIAAIAKHIDALRGQERWGVGSIDQAFTGYTALPAPFEWDEILEMSPRTGMTRSLENAESQYKILAHRHHPDKGGSQEKMAELNAAIRQARKELA